MWNTVNKIHTQDIETKRKSRKIKNLGEIKNSRRK